MTSEQIRSMQEFLGIAEKPATVYKHIDQRCDPGYDIWLKGYGEELRAQCEKKLVESHLKNLGKELFTNTFQF